MFVDSDDTLLGDVMTRIIEVVENHSVDLYIFQTTYHKENGSIIESNFFENKNEISAEEYIKAMLIGTTSVGPFSKVFISEKAKKGLFDIKLKIGEDFLFLLSYTSQYVDKIIVSHFSSYNYFYNIFLKTKYRPSCKKDLQRYILQNTQLQKKRKVGCQSNRLFFLKEVGVTE